MSMRRHHRNRTSADQLHRLIDKEMRNGILSRIQARPQAGRVASKRDTNYDVEWLFHTSD
ncbi:hypothetical protein YC2023_080270 [Brassica napus]